VNLTPIPSPDVHVVLCSPEDPRNIGAAIRAVANHGLGGLTMVRAEPPDPEDLFHYSAGAVETVPVRHVTTLDEALAGARLVLGTSRRPRTENAPTFWPVGGLRARLPADTRVALMFGTERTGLTREELDRCDAVVVVPTEERFPSLNLSHAVAIVGYELARPAPPASVPVAERPRATAVVRDAFFARVHEVVAELGYPPGRTPEVFVRKLRRVLERANLSQPEFGVLAGVFVEMQRLGRLARGSSPPTLSGEQE
jgi:TrmH family RNA methyltransferase